MRSGFINKCEQFKCTHIDMRLSKWKLLIVPLFSKRKKVLYLLHGIKFFKAIHTVIHIVSKWVGTLYFKTYFKFCLWIVKVTKHLWATLWNRLVCSAHMVVTCCSRFIQYPPLLLFNRFYKVAIFWWIFHDRLISLASPLPINEEWPIVFGCTLEKIEIPNSTCTDMSKPITGANKSAIK